MLKSLEAYITTAAPSGRDDEAAADADAQTADKPHSLHRLREQIPDALAREALVQAAVVEDSGKIVEPASGDTIEMIPDGTLVNLKLCGASVDPQQYLVATTAALEGDAVFFQRFEPATGGDTGWFLGAVGKRESETAAADVSLIAVGIETLLRRRPALAPFLATKPDYLLVLDEDDEVEVVLDRRGLDVWDPGAEMLPGGEPSSPEHEAATS
jgi:hypothetical protein